MKKITLTLLLSIITIGNAFAQMETHSASTDVMIAENTAEGTKQTLELQKSLKLLKDASDKVTKINSYLKQLSSMENIVKNQKDAIKTASDISSIFKKDKKLARSAKTYGKIIVQNLKSISQSITLVNAIMSKGFFSMSDAERLEFLTEQEKNISFQTAKIKNYKNTILMFR